VSCFFSSEGLFSSILSPKEHPAHPPSSPSIFSRPSPSQFVIAPRPPPSSPPPSDTGLPFLCELLGPRNSPPNFFAIYLFVSTFPREGRAGIEKVFPELSSRFLLSFLFPIGIFGCFERSLPSEIGSQQTPQGLFQIPGAPYPLLGSPCGEAVVLPLALPPPFFPYRGSLVRNRVICGVAVTQSRVVPRVFLPSVIPGSPFPSRAQSPLSH